MRRLPLPGHPLETSRLLLNLLTLATLAAVFAAVVLGGYPAGGITLLLVLAALLVWSVRFRKESLRRLEVERAEDLLAHAELLEQRQQYARDRGFAYEETSAGPAVGFGRIEQHVPQDPAEWEGGATMGERVKEAPHLERLVGLARHARELVAEGVVRMDREGFRVTVFDLELVDHEDLGGLVRMLKPAAALEASKDYVTVWSVELPFPLPYVSSAYAWDGRRDPVEALAEGRSGSNGGPRTGSSPTGCCPTRPCARTPSPTPPTRGSSTEPGSSPAPAPTGAWTRGPWRPPPPAWPGSPPGCRGRSWSASG